jgi:hypothetical protein
MALAEAVSILDVAAGREGVFEYRGRPALAIAGTPPAHASVADLLFIRRILDECRIPFLLVRNRGERPVLAVDIADAARLSTALSAGCASQPFYVKFRDGESFGPSRPLSGDWLTPLPAGRVFRVFRRRVDVRSGLGYGGITAVQIELWGFGAEHVDLPAPNILTRRRVRSTQLARGTINLFGETWPTIDGMFTPEATDIGFVIDLVFSWVDGASSQWQAMRAKRMSSYVVADEDRSPARFRQIDELKYSLRSVHMYAPWVRRIFIATDSPRPPWLADHPRVMIVRSKEFFKDPNVLPTHNSHAIECQLQHIPGLAEHFIYSNDDMFFGRPVKPTMFFSSGHVSKFIESDVRIGLGEPDDALSGFENAARVNRRILRERFGVITTRHRAHAPAPLRRSVLEEMEQEFASQFSATAASPFRSRTDISVTNSLYHYYALLTGRAVIQDRAKVAYVDTTIRSDLDAMDRLLKKRSNHFFCLNDGGRAEVDPKQRSRRVIDFLERYYPVAAPWEIA